MQRTVAAMTVDTPAAPYDLAGTEYTFYMNPHAAKSYVDAFVLHVAELYFPKVGRPWHWHEFMVGTDTYLAEPTVGVPTVWPYSGTGIVTHHNSEDTPDKVDVRSLRDLAVVNATYLYTLANAGEPDVLWLAELAANRGQEQILSAAAPFIDRALRAPNGEELSRLLAQGIEKITYSVDRESQSVLSVLRLVAMAGRRQHASSLTAVGPRSRKLRRRPGRTVARGRESQSVADRTRRSTVEPRSGLRSSTGRSRAYCRQAQAVRNDSARRDSIRTSAKAIRPARGMDP